MSERLERILRADFLGGIDRLTVEELREMRRDCELEEHGLSYARRLVQGKLDIVRAEAIRRRDEDGGGDLLGSLPTVLGDQWPTRPSSARAVRLLPPPEVLEHVEAAEALGEATVATIRDRDEDEIARLAARLAESERELSEMRQTVFARIDAIQTELTERYKSGAADVREVLRT